jgi:hypothetical protein
MIDFQQLADRLHVCAMGELSIDEFEDWFEEASWNVHQSNDEKLIGAVFGIESLFSALSGGRICEQELLAEFATRAKKMESEWLARSVRPFVLTADAPGGVLVAAEGCTSMRAADNAAGRSWRQSSSTVAAAPISLRPDFAV